MAAITAPRSVGEIETFITMLRTACSDKSVYERLERLLSLPDVKRQAVVHAWVSDLLINGAPRDFIQAIACLSDDRVAERAYEAICQCARENKPPRKAGSPRAWILSGLTAFAALVVVSAILLSPGKRSFTEIAPGAPVAIRGPATQAYEDAWWSAVRPKLAELCGSLSGRIFGDYPFVVFVDSAGRVVRVDVWGAEDEIALLLKREMAGMPLPAFTPEQAAERRTLGLRGRLSVSSDRCTLQRGGWGHLLPTV